MLCLGSFQKANQTTLRTTLGCPSSTERINAWPNTPLFHASRRDEVVSLSVLFIDGEMGCFMFSFLFSLSLPPAICECSEVRDSTVKRESLKLM